VSELPSDGLPHEVAALLGVELPPTPAAVAVERALIDHWLEVYEDTNPVYWDANYARSSRHGGLVAPPAMLIAWLLPYTWRPGGRAAPRELSQVHFKLKALLGLPHGIITRARIDWYAPIRVGDRLSWSEMVRSVSPWKRTRLGTGRFWVIDMRIRNQRGHLVALQTWTALGYGSDSSNAPTATEMSPPAPSQRLMAAPDSPPQTPLSALESRTFETIARGDRLPPLTMPLSVTRAIMAASANRDWQQLHHDQDFARAKAKTRDLAIGLWFFMGMYSRFLTDWAGPEAELRSLEFRMLAQLCPGDVMTIGGSVAAMREDGNDHLVDLGLTLDNQFGPVAPATATLSLPSCR
jgi:acyl dehydratase